MVVAGIHRSTNSQIFVAPVPPPSQDQLESRTPGASSAGLWHLDQLGPVDKPVLAPAQPERLGRCNTDVATGVAR
jgi:hypothetical protein